MLESLHFNTVAYLLPIPITLFLVLAVVGCTSISPGIPNIYLISLSQGKEFVRIGYYGMCANTSGSTTCSSTVGLSADDASKTLSVGFNTVKDLYALQSKVFLPLVAIAGAVFLTSTVSLGIYKRCEKRTSHGNVSPRTMSTSRIMSLFTAWTSAALLLAAAWAVTLSTSALVIASQGSQGTISSESVKSGVSLQALQWVAAIFGCVYALGVGLMLRSNGGGTSKAPKAGIGKATGSNRPREF